MPTFKEFMNLAEITLKDNTSPKRMEEIVSIMRRYHAARGLTPERAVQILEALGPTYVKIGQLASSRSDILPADYCKAFEKLQANVAPLDFQTVLECIDQAYGASWKTVFSSIDDVPLGSASIAQVHKAALLDGSVVAVKVRRPGIVKQMAEDITMMKHILAWGEFIVPSRQSMMLNLKSFVSELERTTANEVDFTIELHNLVRFHQQIEDEPGVTSPLPYPSISTDSVLVMEYVRGVELDVLVQQSEKERQAKENQVGLGGDRQEDVDGTGGGSPASHAPSLAPGNAPAPAGMAVGAQLEGEAGPEGMGASVSVGWGPASMDAEGALPLDQNPKEVARRLVQSYVAQVLDDGFFHADPHPGNIVVRDNEVVWIDLGMMGALSGSQRAQVNQMFHAVMVGSAYQLKEAVLALSAINGPVDQGKLLSQMAVLLQKYGSADLSDINIGSVLEEIIEVMRSQNLIVAPAVTMLARGAMTIEGVLAAIAPDINVLKVVSQHVMKREFSPSVMQNHLLGLAGSAAQSAEALVGLPRRAAETLDMLDRGELSVTADVKVPENALATMYAICGRLVLAMISVGLMLGSSILCTTQMEPKILGVPLLGAFGFLGAFVLGVYVIVRVMQSRHEMANNLDVK